MIFPYAYIYSDNIILYRENEQARQEEERIEFRKREQEARLRAETRERELAEEIQRKEEEAKAALAAANQRAEEELRRRYMYCIISTPLALKLHA